MGRQEWMYCRFVGCWVMPLDQLGLCNLKIKLEGEHNCPTFPKRTSEYLCAANYTRNAQLGNRSFSLITLAFHPKVMP